MIKGLQTPCLILSLILLWGKFLFFNLICYTLLKDEFSAFLKYSFHSLFMEKFRNREYQTAI